MNRLISAAGGKHQAAWANTMLVMKASPQEEAPSAFLPLSRSVQGLDLLANPLGIAAFRFNQQI